MKHILAAAVVAIGFATIPQAGFAADREVKNEIQCDSAYGQRNECRVEGAIQSAQMTEALSPVPCQYGYTWGFIQDGIWVSNGCSAKFEIASIVQEVSVDPKVLEARVKRLQEANSKLRDEVAQLSTVPVARDINTCTKEIGDKAGEQSFRITAILSATRRQRGWNIIGNTIIGSGDDRQTGTFICQTFRRKVERFIFPL